jgi:MFS family permease
MMNTEKMPAKTDRNSARHSISVGLLNFIVGPMFVGYLLEHLGWGEMSYLGGLLYFGIPLGLVLGVLSGRYSYRMKDDKMEWPMKLLQASKWIMSYACGMLVAWFGADLVEYLDDAYYLWAINNEAHHIWQLIEYGIALALALGVVAGVAAFKLLIRIFENRQNKRTGVSE